MIRFLPAVLVLLPKGMFAMAMIVFTPHRLGWMQSHFTGNKIGVQGAAAFAQALQSNTTLKTLDVGCMPRTELAIFCDINCSYLTPHQAGSDCTNFASFFTKGLFCIQRSISSNCS